MAPTFEPSAETLAGIHLFRDLDADARASIARACQGLRFNSGETVVSDHEPTSDVYFLLSGRVLVKIYSVSGKEVTFRELGPGEHFGDLAAIDGATRSATVVALEDSLVLKMGARSFWAVLGEHPEVVSALLRRFAGMVRDLSDRIFEFSTLAVNNRIHAELLRIAREHMSGDREAVIPRPPTHQRIATRISTHREAVTRELARLQDTGLIERRGGALVVTDVPGLEHMVEEVKGPLEREPGR